MVRYLDFILSDLGNCTVLSIGNTMESSSKELLWFVLSGKNEEKKSKSKAKLEESNRVSVVVWSGKGGERRLLFKVVGFGTKFGST